MEIRALDGDDPATIRALLPGFQETMRAALPDDPPASEQLLARLLQRRRGTDRVVLAAFDGDDPVGYAKLGLDLSATLDVGHGSLWVFPAYRRAGAGRQLIEACQAELRQRNRSRLLIDAPRTVAAEEFAGAVGGKLIATNLRNRLFLKAAKLSAVEVPGYDLIRWNEHCPDEFVDAYAAAWRQMDVAVNGQAVSAGATAKDVRAKEEENLRAEHRQYAVAAVHPETGVIAGYSTMFVRQSPMADAGETLVLSEHREHGLGTWLKSDLIAWAAGENPQVALVQAWNDETNTAVNALNRKLGFVTSGAWSTFEF